ncbi:hypothetical protein FRC03_004657, partial [Tulasnella sp. 419]
MPMEYKKDVLVPHPSHRLLIYLFSIPMRVTDPPVLSYPLSAGFLSKLKKALDGEQRSVYPNILYMDSQRHELCILFYPMLDEDCQVPVPMGDYNGHRTSYQFPNIGCFCSILYNNPKPAKMFQVTRETSEWLGEWILGCGNYRKGNSDGGCGFWQPLGPTEYDTARMKYFQEARSDGSQPPVHFYPPIAHAPDPPPRIVIPFPFVKDVDSESMLSSPLKTPFRSQRDWTPPVYTPTNIRTPKYRTTPSASTRPKPRRAPIDADPEDILRPRTYRVKAEALEKEGVLHRDPSNRLTVGPLGHRLLGDDNIGSSSQSTEPDLASEISSTARFSPYPALGSVKSKGKESSAKKITKKGAQIDKRQETDSDAITKVVHNYHVLLRLLNPASAGISEKEMRSIVWACSSCKGTFIKDIKEDHKSFCKPSSASDEVIVITDTEEEEEVTRKA